MKTDLVATDQLMRLAEDLAACAAGLPRQGSAAPSQGSRLEYMRMAIADAKSEASGGIQTLDALARRRFLASVLHIVRLDLGPSS
jgi:hypothetical protein